MFDGNGIHVQAAAALRFRGASLRAPEETPAATRFEDVHEVTLASPLLRDDSALELQTGKTMPQQIDDDVMLTLRQLRPVAAK